MIAMVKSLKHVWYLTYFMPARLLPESVYIKAGGAGLTHAHVLSVQTVRTVLVSRVC